MIEGHSVHHHMIEDQTVQIPTVPVWTQKRSKRPRQVRPVSQSVEAERRCSGGSTSSNGTFAMHRPRWMANAARHREIGITGKLGIFFDLLDRVRASAGAKQPWRCAPR
jgi:hypothetical protein